MVTDAQSSIRDPLPPRSPTRTSAPKPKDARPDSPDTLCIFDVSLVAAIHCRCHPEGRLLSRRISPDFWRVRTDGVCLLVAQGALAPLASGPGDFSCSHAGALFGARWGSPTRAGFARAGVQDLRHFLRMRFSCRLVDLRWWKPLGYCFETSQQALSSRAAVIAHSCARWAASEGSAVSIKPISFEQISSFERRFP
jgi:hypothetical protein